MPHFHTGDVLAWTDYSHVPHTYVCCEMQRMRVSCIFWKMRLVLTITLMRLFLEELHQVHVFFLTYHAPLLPLERQRCRALLAKCAVAAGVYKRRVFRMKLLLTDNAGRIRLEMASPRCFLTLSLIPLLRFWDACVVLASRIYRPATNLRSDGCTSLYRDTCHFVLSHVANGSVSVKLSSKPIPPSI